MPNPQSPKTGETFYYLGRTRCTVVGTTLKPGGINIDEAVVQIETVPQGTPHVFLYSTSARYLSAVKISWMKPWPLTNKAV